MCHIQPIYAFFYWDCTSVQNFRAIGPLFMEILHVKDLGDTSFVSVCSLGVNLVIDNLCYVVSDTSPLYKIWKQSDHYLWRYCILKIWGISVVSECSLGDNLVIDNFLYVASGTSPPYKIWKQLDHYLCRYCILKIWGIRVSFGSVVLVLGEYQISIAKYLRGYLPTYKIWKR